jgi:hypothetical protein
MPSGLEANDSNQSDCEPDTKIAYRRGLSRSSRIWATYILERALRQHSRLLEGFGNPAIRQRGQSLYSTEPFSYTNLLIFGRQRGSPSLIA